MVAKIHGKDNVENREYEDTINDEAINAKTYGMKIESVANVYNDLSDIPNWAKSAVGAFSKKRGIDGNFILEPMEDGRYHLNDSMLRVIVMMYRAGYAHR